MGKVYLIRHGEVAWNRENAYVGVTDLPLNDTGRAQAASLADYLKNKNLSAIYSSNLSRARETAENIASRTGLTVQVVPELHEVNYGDWEGVNEQEIARRWEKEFHEWRSEPMRVRIPGGEFLSEMRDRAYGTFRTIARSHPDENIAIVAHKTVNRVILCCVMDVDPNRYRRIGQGNACVNIIEVRPDGSFMADTINERCFLHDAEGEDSAAT